MVKLSAVIITFNEEKNIARCLQSLKDVADEIVVLDSFSADKTEEICKQYGAKFFQHKFDGHIQQKNRAITFASNKYVLSLDADEALSDELKKSIAAVKNNWQHDGYYMNRLTNYCGQWIKHCGWYPDTKLRLWDSTKGSWGGVNPHDKYLMRDDKSNTGKLKGDLLHYSYYSIDEHIKQSGYFATIAAKAMYAEGKRANFFNLNINPAVKFIKCYFLKLGFLDGYFGFVICKITAQSTRDKYRKLKNLQSPI
jgi:glycosyltransferase involved in cell wall biosynthesis